MTLVKYGKCFDGINRTVIQNGKSGILESDGVRNICSRWCGSFEYSISIPIVTDLPQVVERRRNIELR